MKWIIENAYEFSTAEEAATHIMEHCDESYYDEMLDDVFGDVNICGCNYSASLALFRTDEIAYNCGRSKWEDSETCSLKEELESMVADFSQEFYGQTVEFFENENEQEDE